MIWMVKGGSGASEGDQAAAASIQGWGEHRVLEPRADTVYKVRIVQVFEKTVKCQVRKGKRNDHQ